MVRAVRALAIGLASAIWLAAPAWAGSVADGFEAFQQGDYQGARDIWLPLAEAGDPVAQFNLGKLYEFGGGDLRQDYAQAARWYREAAAQEVPAAQNNLGLMHAQGRGVPRDAARAAELWHAAAQADHALAQYNLALAYFRGDGVERDEAEAAVWFRKAAEAGLADAQFAMGQMIRLGRVVARDDAQALAWYKLAAVQGHADAAAEAARLEQQGIVPAPPEPARYAIAEATESLAQNEPAIPPPPGAGTDLTVQPVQGGGLAIAAATEEPGVESVQLPDLPPPPEPAVGSAAEPEKTQTAPAPPPEAEPAPQQGASADSQAMAPQDGPSPRPPQEAAVPAEPRETYRIWLLSADSEEAAGDLWRAAKARHEDVLAAVGMTIREVDHGEKGHFYRVLAGPVESREAALALCRSLRTEAPKTFCKVMTP